MYELAIALMATCAVPKYLEQICNCLDTWVIIAEKYNVPVCFICDRISNDILKFKLDKMKNITMINLDLDSSYDSAFYKHIRGYEYLHKTYPAKFYLVGGTDNYFNIPRLLDLLLAYDYQNKFILGGIIDYRSEIMHLNYVDGKGGIIKSYGATLEMINYLDWLIDRWNALIKVSFCAYLRPACDVALGYLATYLGINIISDRRFFHGAWTARPYKYFWNPSYFPEILPLGKYGELYNFVSFHYMDRKDMTLCHRFIDKTWINIIELQMKGRALLITSKNKPISNYISKISHNKNYLIVYDMGNSYLNCLIYEIITGSYFKQCENKTYRTNIWSITSDKTDSIANVISDISKELDATSVNFVSELKGDVQIYIENKDVSEIFTYIDMIDPKNILGITLASYNNQDIAYPDTLDIGIYKYMKTSYGNLHAYERQ